jgi:hypothetical protein
MGYPGDLLGGAAVTASRLASRARQEAVGRLVRSPESLGPRMPPAGVRVSFAVNRGGASPGEATAMLRAAKRVTLALALPWPWAGCLGADRRLARAKDVAIRWRAG